MSKKKKEEILTQSDSFDKVISQSFQQYIYPEQGNVGLSMLDVEPLKRHNISSRNQRDASNRLNSR